MNSIEVVKNVNVEVEGRKIIVSLLKMGEHEGLTIAQAAELFNVSLQNVHQILKRHHFLVSTLSLDQVKSLQKQNVIPLKVTVSNFLPRETLDALVKVIDTPEAWAAHKLLLQAVRDEKTYASVKADQFTTDGKLDLEAFADQFLKCATALKSEVTLRIEAERKTVIADKRAFSSMGTAGAAVKGKTAALELVKAETARADAAEGQLKVVNTRKAINAIGANIVESLAKSAWERKQVWYEFYTFMKTKNYYGEGIAVGVDANQLTPENCDAALAKAKKIQEARNSASTINTTSNLKLLPNSKS